MPQPFIPQTLPLVNFDWSRFVHLIGKANAEVARFDGLLQSIHNPMLLLQPLSTQEAVLSSKIEGTQATLEEVLRYEANPNENVPRFADIQEVVNYKNALHHGVENLNKVSLSLRLIREMHEILMTGVRGKDRAPGVFRRIQNWIGPPGSTIENATFVPPGPQNLLDMLGNFEKYVHIDDKDILVQAAILHGQFEIIHPFMDGNGRLGRILFPVFLYFKKVLSYPLFFQSAYFELHRDEYYAKLLRISKDNDWNSWIEYFLVGVVEQSRINIEKVRAIHSLYEQKKERIAEVTKSQYAIRVLDFLFGKPIFSTPDFIEQTKISKATAKRILQQLEKAEVISSVRKGTGSMGSVFAFRKLIRLLHS